MLLRNLLEAKTNGNGMLIVLGLLVVMFVVMGIFNRKQRKKQVEAEQKRKDALCPGTKIITIGGIIGVVESVDNETNSYVLNSNGSLIKLDKRSIYQMDLPEGAKVEEAPVVEEAPAVEEVKEEVKE